MEAQVTVFISCLSLRHAAAYAFEPGFLPLLRHPGLQSLVHLGVGGGPKFIEAITTVNNQPELSPLPILQSLLIESAHLGVHERLMVKMALSRTKGHLRSLKVDFLSEKEMALEEDVCDEMGLAHVDKRFQWIGVGPRFLEREFMNCDFSLIQSWQV